MSASSESSAPSLSPGAEWRAEALSVLVALWNRRGVVGVEDVESVVPDGAAELDLRDLIAELSAAGVEITIEEGDRYGPAGASVLSRYYRDIGQGKLLDAAGERILARRQRQGVMRRVRAVSRTVAGADAAVAVCRAAAAGQCPVSDVVVDEVGKRGRPALAVAAGRAQAAIDACVLAETKLACRAGSRSVVSGRARVRMSQAVQALGLSVAGIDQMVLAVKRALHAARVFEGQRLLRVGSGGRRCSRRRASFSRLLQGLDSAAFLEAAERRAEQGAAGAEVARRKLIEMNLRLVISFAKRMYRPDLGVSFPDLVQEGNLGLMKAVERFDPAQGRFSTYAAWWIRQAMKRAVSETGRTVRIPVHVQERLADVLAIESELSRQGGWRPAAAEVAGKMGVDPDVVERLRTMPRQSVSLDQPVWSSDEESEAWGARLRDADALDPEREARGREFRKMLRRVMRLELAEVEQAALCRRFGLTELEDPDGARMLQRLTRERVRRLEVRALKKLQASAHAEPLRDFLGPDAFAVAAGG